MTEVPSPLTDEPILAAPLASAPEASALEASARPGRDLFLVSFLILFLQLACIRYFASFVVFLTFFTNIVLMASFLGMTVGCLAASRKANLIKVVLPLLFTAVTLAVVVYVTYQNYGNKVSFDVGNQQSPQLIFFGTEYRPADPTRFVVPMELIAGVFFVLLSIIFVGLGQVMGRSFDAISGRIKAYTINIAGSLIGIVAFAAASWFWTTPLLWFGVSVLVVMMLLPRLCKTQMFSMLGLIAIVAACSFGRVDKQTDTRLSQKPDPVKVTKPQVIWSPYYKIAYTPQTGEIDTNNISHQQMVNVSKAGPAYVLPHLLARDSGVKSFDDVVIIGAGSGNDVSAAEQNGAKWIDAVEIDPAINAIGKADHPERPYDQVDRVKVHYDDGRSFLRKTEKKYDLAVYALVDSLVLHSGYSSIRLESFLFTKQAFTDVKNTLKPGGVFAMYNYYRQGWVIGRLKAMAFEIFGVEPIVVSMPYQETISATDNQANHITFLLVGLPDKPGEKTNATIEAIKAKFAANQFYWLNENPSVQKSRNAFASTQPSDDGSWRKIGLASVSTENIGRIPEDNYPFLYARDAAIPVRPNLVGIGMIAGLSLIILFAFAPVRAIKPSGRMFFLGAGFMLLETKGVVHMSLLFGSTWIVNSVVFFAILVMILIANIFVAIVKPEKMLVVYILLIVALLVNVFVPMTWFLQLAGVWKIVGSCAVITLPILFAGVIFATSFRKSTNPAGDMGSNIAGVIVGGLSENLSMVFGFQYLVLIAIGFYLLSSIFDRRAIPAT